MRVVVMILTYVVGSVGFQGIWTRLGHVQHAMDPPVWLDGIVLVGVVPFLLGVACVQMTRASRAGLVALVVAPFVALAFRLWLDDVPGQWLSANVGRMAAATLPGSVLAVAGGLARRRFGDM